VVYSQSSGAILPELQWRETYTIARSGVRLERRGAISGTLVNEGQWDAIPDPAGIELLFSQLEGLDCSTLQRLEPEDSPDGGGNSGYEVHYGTNQVLALLYEPGVTYRGDAPITGAVDRLIESLVLPAQAIPQHTEGQ